MAELGVPAVLMHAQGDPRTMQLAPSYDNVALDVYDHLEERLAAARAAGIEQLVIDPGIGFGKSFAHNLEVLSQLTLVSWAWRSAAGGPFAQGLYRGVNR